MGATPQVRLPRARHLSQPRLDRSHSLLSRPVAKRAKAQLNNADGVGAVRATWMLKRLPSSVRLAMSRVSPAAFASLVQFCSLHVTTVSCQFSCRVVACN